MACTASAQALAELFTTAGQLNASAAEAACSHSPAACAALANSSRSTGHQLSPLNRLAQALGADIAIELLAIQRVYVFGRLKQLFAGDAVYGEFADPEVPEVVETEAIEGMAVRFQAVQLTKFHVEQGKWKSTQELIGEDKYYLCNFIRECACLQTNGLRGHARCSSPTVKRILP